MIDPCFTGVLCISSYVLLFLVAPGLCLTPFLRWFCVFHFYVLLSYVISCCSGIVFDPCLTGVWRISSYVLLSLVAWALCLAPCFLGVLCILCLVISCCSGIVFDPCFTGVLCISSYVLLFLVAPALCLTPVFTGAVRISSYVLLSLVAPALCLTPVLRVLCVSLLMSCYLLLLQHCV